MARTLRGWLTSRLGVATPQATSIESSPVVEPATTLVDVGGLLECTRVSQDQSEVSAPESVRYAQFGDADQAVVDLVPALKGQYNYQLEPVGGKEVSTDLLSRIDSSSCPPDPAPITLHAYATPHDWSKLYVLPRPFEFSLVVNLFGSIVVQDLALDSPAHMDISFQYPATVDLASALREPRSAGKSYGQAKPARSRVAANERSETNRCRHGIDRRLCARCRGDESAKRGRATASQVTTVDVFDLVYPLLCPPIGPDSPLQVVFPPGMQPYPFQYEGIRFLTEHRSALLADEMGLGKTIQAIVAMRILVRDQQVRRALIVCPRSLLGTWMREMQRWAPELSVQQVRGPLHDRRLQWYSGAYAFLTTYETLRNDVEGGIPLSDRFDLVVLDEAQRIKNFESQTSRACRHVSARYRWGLTGTPLENRLDDVASIFSYLCPRLLAELNQVLSAYAVREAIRPLLLRRRAADVLDELPDKVEEEIWLDLTDGQRHAYDEAEDAGIDILRGPTVTRVHVFNLINELKQICNWDPESRTSCKLEYLQDTLGGIVDAAEKALLFSHYPNKSLAALKPHLRDFYPEIFDGSMSDRAREDLINRFMAEGPPHVLMASVKAGGLGLTLTRANHVFHYDHWWNPAVANQATGRAHRIGQTRTVFVHHMYVSGTIEERIYDLLAKKQRLFNLVIDDLSDEDFITTVTDDELFGLFGVRPPAAATRTTVSALPSAEALAAKSLPIQMDQSLTSAIARMYRSQGFTIELPELPAHEGADLVAVWPSRTGPAYYTLIRCLDTPGESVGPSEVWVILRARRANVMARAATLITTGTVTLAATEIAKRWGVYILQGELRDGYFVSTGIDNNRGAEG